MPIPKYPQISVDMVGQDGNAFAIMGRVTKAMRRAGLGNDIQQAFRDEAMSGDYDNLLRVVMNTVNVDDFDE